MDMSDTFATRLKPALSQDSKQDSPQCPLPEPQQSSVPESDDKGVVELSIATVAKIQSLLLDWMHDYEAGGDMGKDSPLLQRKELILGQKRSVVEAVIALSAAAIKLGDHAAGDLSADDYERLSREDADIIARYLQPHTDTDSHEHDRREVAPGDSP